MQLQTAVTRLLDIEHPVLLAAMDLVADAPLAAAVIRAGELIRRMVEEAAGLLGAAPDFLAENSRQSLASIEAR